MTENHVTAIQADQSNPFGPELSPIDTSVLGQKVVITKSSSSGGGANNNDNNNNKSTTECQNHKH